MASPKGSQPCPNRPNPSLPRFPSSPPGTPVDSSAAAAAPGQSPPPPRKKRRWLKFLAALALLLILLVVLLPTIISLSPVRSLLVSKAQGYLNGRLEVASWSFGWLSGTKIDGVKVFDHDGTLIAEADQIDTGLSLLSLVRGNYDLGHTVIDVNATKLVVRPDGSINYLDLLPKSDKPSSPKSEKADSSKSGEPITVPDVKGDIELHLRGSAQLVDANGKSVDVQLRDGSGGTIKIADINQGISPDLKFIYDVAGKAQSEVDIAGTVDAIDNNKLDTAALLQTLRAKLKLALTNVDLGASQPFLAMAGKADTSLNGIANGALDVDLQPGADGGAKGEIVISKFAFTGPQLADRYAADTVRLPINVTRSAKDGKVIDTLDIKAILPEVSVAIAGDVPETAIENLQKKLAPGATGWVSITTTANAAKLAAALPKTLQVLPDAKITGGELVSRIDVGIRPEILVTKTQTDFSLTGTRGGQAKSIRPINIVTDASLTMPQTPSKMSLAITSDFAHFSGGGETLTQLHGEGSADLEKLRTQLAQFFDLGGIKLDGQVDVSLKSNTTGSDLALTVAANVNRLLLSLPGKPPLNLPFLKLAADAKATLQGNTPTGIQLVTATVLAGNDPSQPVLDTALSATAIDLNTYKVGGFKVDHLTVTDAATLQKQFIDPFVPALQNQQIVIANGQIYLAATGSADPAAGAYALSNCEASLQNIKIVKAGKTAFDDDLKVATSAGITTQNKIMHVTLPSLSLNSRLVTVNAKDVRAQQPSDDVPITAAVQSGTVDVMAGDLAKLQAIAAVFGTQLPVDISGGATIHTAVKDGVANVDFAGSKIALKNAKGQSYAFAKPVTFALSASAKGSPKIDQFDVSKLSGDFGVATLAMPQPISVTNLPTTPTPSGQIELAGAIENIAPLLQVIQSADTPLPYKGLFNFRQAVATKGDDITLKGDGTIDNFEADDATGKPSFTEKQITIANDLTANPKTHHAVINTFSAEMTASQAAKITATGSIANWDTSRTIEGSGLVATVKYDAAKLWPIVYAKMSAEQQKSYADAKVVGAFEKKFTVTGSYPAAKTMGESIKPLKADGSIELTQFTGGGIDLHQLLLNIVLNKGVITLSQQPARINDGTLSLDKVQVDLTQTDLRLFTPKNLQLVSKASINPALGDTLGKYINPAFANAKQAKGLLSVTVNECKSVALSPAALQSVNSGSATITINIQDMDIANPLGSLLLGPIVDKLGSGMSSDADTFQGELKDGKVVLNKGVVTNNLVMTLSKPVQITDARTGKTATVPKGMPLGFAGDTRLRDLEMNMKVSIPAAMIASIAGMQEKKLTDILPDGLILPLKGVATAPKVDFSGVLGKIGEGVLKSKLSGDDKNGIGDLLKGLEKKKKKKDVGQ